MGAGVSVGAVGPAEVVGIFEGDSEGLIDGLPVGCGVGFFVGDEVGCIQTQRDETVVR